MRKPSSLRELMASCLRSIYSGNPFSQPEHTMPELPAQLRDEVSIYEQHVDGIRCAIYSPKSSGSRRPMILYMHGGGFVIGCSEDVDYITRTLSYENNCVVVSVNYRLAPETVFPGALQDCEKALEWALNHASELNIDSSNFFLAGDSAGGTLAASLAQILAQRHRPALGLVALAPWLDMAVESYDSYNSLAPTGIVFDAAFLGYARAAYVGFEQWKNPLVSPLLCPPSKLPPTLVLIGTEDPLLDQTLRLKQQSLEQRCEHIEFEIYLGMPHCFYSFPNLFAEERIAFERICEFIDRTRKSVIDKPIHLNG